MKYVDYVVDQIKYHTKKDTPTEMYLRIGWLWLQTGMEENINFIEDGDTFDDTVEEYALRDSVELSRCAWAVYNAGSRKINFLLAVNDTLNNDDHDKNA